MEPRRSGTQPSAKGPEANFTGAVRVGPLFEAPAPVGDAECETGSNAE